MFERPLRRHVKAALAITAIAGVSLVPSAASAAPAAASPSTVTLVYPSSGDYVAPGLGTLVVTAVGGSGGNGAPGPGSNGGAGGAGASVTETFPVSGGERFTAYPASAGGSAQQAGFTALSVPGAAGFEGASGSYGDDYSGAGGGGGGMTQVVDDTNGSLLEAASGGGGGGGGGAVVGYDGGQGAAYPDAGATGQGPGAGSGGSGASAGAQSGSSAALGTSAGGGGGGGGGFPGSGVSGQAGTIGGGGGGGGAAGEAYGSTVRDGNPVIGVAASLGDGSVTFTFIPSGPSQIAVNSVKASPNPAVAGNPVTLTDTLTPYGTGLPVPSGVVEFEEYNITSGASTVIGPASISNGIASLAVPLTAGTHYLYAAYQGDATFYADNSAIITEVVNAAQTTLTVTPQPVAFGKLTDGLTKAETITVTNTGNLPWLPSSIGSNSSDFSFSAAGVGSTSVAPGASYTFTVTFSPTVVGPDNATITVTSNFPALSINVTATGVALRPPSITSISPASGTVKGGTTVTVTGTNLSQVTAATVGTKPALSFSCATAASCVVVTPPGSGTVPIRLTNKAGTSTLVPGDRFTYEKP